jgi:glycosyltransferase involved in cell wall biosynthesis
VTARLRVLLDATSVPPTQGGVARFIGGLLQGLDELGETIDVVAKRADIPAFAAVAPSHNYIVAPPLTNRRPLRLVWEQLGLPALARRRGALVIHSPHYTFPILGAAAHVVTVHDATFFSSPDVHGRVKGIFFRTWIRLAARMATSLVAVSQATASDLARFVRIPAAGIQVAHLGVDERVFSPPTADAVAAVRARISLQPDAPYLAFLGTLEPRKNVPALLAAHATLRQSDPTTPVLVLSGARGWDERAAEILDELSTIPLPQRPVIEAGYLPLELLSAFLGDSAAVVYPSLGEGFGLPVLEAMASGAAVLTTRRLSIPEVGGDAVAYSEPDAGALATALRALLDDPDRRAELAAAGIERSALFTWSECARRYCEAWRSAESTRS